MSYVLCLMYYVFCLAKDTELDIQQYPRLYIVPKTEAKPKKNKDSKHKQDSFEPSVSVLALLPPESAGEALLSPASEGEALIPPVFQVKHFSRNYRQITYLLQLQMKNLYPL